MSKRQTGFGSLGGLVFSTDSGRMCPGCQKPQAAGVDAYYRNPQIGNKGCRFQNSSIAANAEKQIETGIQFCEC